MDELGASQAKARKTYVSQSIEARALRIVEQVLELADRAAYARFVEEQCGGDEALRGVVTRILAMDQTGVPLLPTATSLVVPTGPEPAEVLPERIGPYKILGIIGRGGMGSVLKAERDDGVFHQVVAIKRIRGDVRDAAAKERFLAERRILGRLVHPGIARILDGGEHEGQPYLVMEYVAGLPVSQALRRDRPGVETILDMFEAVCSAVVHAHRNLIVHADIKPSNVLAGADGAIRLVDFGIARLIVDLEPETDAAPYPVTPGYAAPECLAGAPPSIASDVFSLGVLLHEMLTGVLPTEGSAMSMAAGGDNRIARHLLRGDLDAIVARALASDPAERYPDVTVLLGDIRRHRLHVPVAARAAEGWRYAAAKFIRRHRTGLAITSATMALLLAAAIVSTTQYLTAERERREAVARFADAHASAHYLLFTVMPRLEQRPGTLPLRAEIAGVAQHYLDRLSGALRTSDPVRLEAAEGLWRLAEFQGKTGRPNLGQVKQADANLRHSEAIAAKLPGQGARVLLAHVRLDRSALAADMNSDAAAADRILQDAAQSVAAAEAGAPELRFDYRATTASLRIWQGRYPEAEAAAREALAQLPARDDAREGRDRLLTRARLTDILAEAIYYSHPALAEPFYAAQVAMLEVAHRRWPQDNYILMRLSRAHWNIGTMMMELKRFKLAERVLAQAEMEARRTLAFDLADLEAARLLRIATTAHAQALAHLGRIGEAMAVFVQVTKRDEARWLADPGNARAARDYVYDHAVIGESLDAAGRYAEACASDRRTLTLYQMLAQRRSLQQLDVDHNVKLVQDRIAHNCKR